MKQQHSEISTCTESTAVVSEYLQLPDCIRGAFKTGLFAFTIFEFVTASSSFSTETGMSAVPNFGIVLVIKITTKSLFTLFDVRTFHFYNRN